MEQWIDEAWGAAADKLARTSERIGASFPLASIRGRYDNRDVDCWTNGFWPGILWHAYRETGDERYRRIACAVEVRLDEPLQEYEKLHHDNGFLWSLSAVADYKLTGDPMSRRRGLIAASHLASRFNLKGGFIRAWLYPGSEGLAIIDCMMNLGLLFWASDELGDPRFRHLAVAHADRTRLEFVREDGSVHHIVRFDPETGERMEALGGQGYAPDSAWSRGAAWAIYGFAIGYRYTRERRFLETAKKVADFFVGQFAEGTDDLAPPWDFRAPAESRGVKDTTAAACAASGLLEIAEQLGEDGEAEFYRNWGTRIVRSLYESYRPEDPGEEALIVKGTGSYPHGNEVETPLIYGDYFYVEALLKLKGRSELFW
ncbi:glycoside hydrolase family 88 protein [Cohnella thailandensis]|uniref:Glycoside hydrolase family 88 protein n=1 Tax=Cohnella thailandensis TaxID=557557 RepID=A0A841T927_9BACL|nr:glycoside hydrolase family 88 protein [Cohnella thailandensis]MBB6637701.1 glycoside hydrolase family 88 protein [Cohnella thailandensis]MBP1974122.1 unsaturated chondroitin disaccharide hydrolase [Cohnella thailandensis]